jgi:hypothetical protein
LAEDISPDQAEAALTRVHDSSRRVRSPASTMPVYCVVNGLVGLHRTDASRVRRRRRHPAEPPSPSGAPPVTGEHPRHDLDELLVHRVRLSIVAALADVGRAEFALVRDRVEVTDPMLSKQVAMPSSHGPAGDRQRRAQRMRTLSATVRMTDSAMDTRIIIRQPSPPPSGRTDTFLKRMPVPNGRMAAGVEGAAAGGGRGRR